MNDDEMKLKIEEICDSCCLENRQSQCWGCQIFSHGDILYPEDCKYSLELEILSQAYEPFEDGVV